MGSDDGSFLGCQRELFDGRRATNLMGFIINFDPILYLCRSVNGKANDPRHVI